MYFYNVCVKFVFFVIFNLSYSFIFIYKKDEWFKSGLLKWEGNDENSNINIIV